jgi:hypothetical protein
MIEKRGFPLFSQDAAVGGSVEPKKHLRSNQTGRRNTSPEPLIRHGPASDVGPRRKTIRFRLLRSLPKASGSPAAIRVLLRPRSSRELSRTAEGTTQVPLGKAARSHLTI